MKTAIEFLIDYYACKNIEELQRGFGKAPRINILSEAMQGYAEYYHQEGLRKLHAKKAAFITMDMDDMESWDNNFA